MKLKDKLKNWLFKEELNDIKETKARLCAAEDDIRATKVNVDGINATYEECLQRMNQGYIKIRDAADLHDKSHILLEDCRKFMNSICDVGTDVGFQSSDHSWAVICVHGKIDYVKFVDMSHRDIQDIAYFLKKFEYSNRVTDSPIYKGIFEDIIKKW